MISKQTRYSPVEISVDFIKRRPKSALELVFRDDADVKHKSNKFKEGDLVHWNIDTVVRTNASAILTIRRTLFNVTVAEIEIKFRPNEFGDYRAIGLEGCSFLSPSEMLFTLSIFTDHNIWSR
ncbi:hypothetical protein V8E53_007493 [Lactarius tabidus]